MSLSGKVKNDSQRFWQQKNFPAWIILITGLVFALVFVFVSYLAYKPGFPLDDSWIHQTYARNLAKTGLWQFVPGETSGGSTSPLWTMLLALGYLIGFSSPFVWTVAMSAVCFSLLAWTTYKTLNEKLQAVQWVAVLGGLLVALEWHLLWAAASGMETILYCLIVNTIFLLLIKGDRWVWVGLLSGLLLWVRPDGITIVGPVYFVLVTNSSKFTRKMRNFVQVSLPIILLLMGLAWFNFSITGTIFPNTFFAKQTEYAVLLSHPLLERVLPIFTVPMAGVGIFLIPGFLYGSFQAFKKWDPWRVAAVLWFFGFGLLYAVRLPVTYQHGRYLIPMIPVFIMLGVLGSVELGTFLGAIRQKQLRVGKILCIAVLMASILFAIVGSKTLTEDNKVIDRLMVEPALWIKANTQGDALVAAHDIGALGFFGDRDLIDLAGLIQPEIIPIMGDEKGLSAMLASRHANYLVVFSDWYEKLDEEGILIVAFEYSKGSVNADVQIRKLK
jgi:hypothetical protein